MRSPTMHVADERAEGNVVHEIFHIVEGCITRRTIIEHEHNACDCQHQEKKKRDAAHSPCVAVVCGMTRNADGMKMQEHVIENLQRAIALIIFVAVTKHGFPHFALRYILLY